MTKPYVAAAIMLLLKENRIRLDDPVARYIPEFGRPRRVQNAQAWITAYPAVSWRSTRPGRAQASIRLRTRPSRPHRQGFSHVSSGLQAAYGIPNDEIPLVTPDDTLATWTARLSDAALGVQPGTQWHYSNATGYEILARVVEVVSGQTFAAFLKERIFEPLG